MGGGWGGMGVILTRRPFCLLSDDVIVIVYCHRRCAMFV